MNKKITLYIVAIYYWHYGIINISEKNCYWKEKYLKMRGGAKTVYILQDSHPIEQSSKNITIWNENMEFNKIYHKRKL